MKTLKRNDLIDVRHELFGANDKEWDEVLNKVKRVVCEGVRDEVREGVERAMGNVVSNPVSNAVLLAVWDLVYL